jgi:DNA-binding transcriptional ArsR family regulator
VCIVELESAQMDLSPVRREILEALLVHEKPVKASQIAKETGKEQPSVQMHLIGLVRMGYAESPQKGQYLVSGKGKEALGVARTTKETALRILSSTPVDKAFHFYGGIGKPLNLYAKNLLDFCDKLNKVDVSSIEFHFNRGDFEAWFKFLGDAELSKVIELLRTKKVAGEKLREEILEITKNRCLLLATIAEQNVPP